IQHRPDGNGRAAAQLRQHDEGVAHAARRRGPGDLYAASHALDRLDRSRAISRRRVTLSLVGIVPGLDRLAREPMMPNLAISLHATTEEQRTALVPPNRKYSLASLIETCRKVPV